MSPSGVGQHASSRRIDPIEQCENLPKLCIVEPVEQLDAGGHRERPCPPDQTPTSRRERHQPTSAIIGIGGPLHELLIRRARRSDA